MKRRTKALALLASGIASIAIATQYAEAADKASKTRKSAERGRYLVQIAGCNDCHTPGYLLSGGKTPEESWLIGDSFGWRGPWGTTYAVNLRLRLKDLTEDQWMTVAKNLKARPPMPSYVLQQMHEDDLRAIYHYVKSLPTAGREAPAYLPPDKEPPQPYALFPSPPPQGK
jgi:mono/diheme cytochrome c family protein